jgi:hypothetical protein
LPGIGGFLDGLSTFVTITAHDLKQVSIRFPILVSPNGSAEMFSPERGQSAEFTNLHFCSAVAVLSAVKGRLGAKSWPWLILQRNVISKDCLSPAEFKTPLATVKIQNTDATCVFSQGKNHPQSAQRTAD